MPEKRTIKEIPKEELGLLLAREISKNPKLAEALQNLKGAIEALLEKHTKSLEIFRGIAPLFLGEMKKEAAAVEAITEHFEALLNDPRLKATPHNHKAIKDIYSRILGASVGRLDEQIDRVDAVASKMGKRGTNKRHARNREMKARAIADYREAKSTNQKLSKDLFAEVSAGEYGVSQQTLRDWLKKI